MIKWLFIMFTLHIIADYNLQGMFIELKQKSWWNEHCPEELYKNDYIIALIEHSLFWSIMIMLPTMFIGTFIWELILLNTIIHAICDNAKANKKIINLFTDQLVHIIQIVLTFILCFV